MSRVVLLSLAALLSLSAHAPDPALAEQPPKILPKMLSGEASSAAIAAPVTPRIIARVEDGAQVAPQSPATAPAAPTAAAVTASVTPAATGTEAVPSPASEGDAEAAAPAAPKKVVKPFVPTLIATIDLTTQSMTVSANGESLHRFAISSGRRGYETPTGTFRPAWKSKMWFSRQYDDAPMPFAVFFNGGIATHGTSAVGMLGRPASHGCIRLTNANAETFYKLVQRHGMGNTRIIVKGSPRFNDAVASRRPEQRARLAAATAAPSPRRIDSQVLPRVVYPAGTQPFETRAYVRAAPATVPRAYTVVTTEPYFRARAPRPQPSWFGPQAAAQSRLVFPGDRPARVTVTRSQR